MNDDDKNVVKKLIDAFITKGKLKQLVPQFLGRLAVPRVKTPGLIDCE